MTIDSGKIKLFTLPEDSPCSYLDGQWSNSVFIDPSIELDSYAFSQLARMGFRRSGQHVYRPHCASCNACIPCRIRVPDFSPSKSQKRIISKHKTTEVRVVPATFYVEHYKLYEKYINTRHQDGDMYPASEEQYISFIADEYKFSSLVEFWHHGRLMAVSLMDTLDDGLSAVYTFFDPDLEHLSPGKYAVIWQAFHANSKDLDYLYLGYWIKNCSKMSYKNQYQPLEILMDFKWIELHD